MTTTAVLHMGNGNIAAPLPIFLYTAAAAIYGIDKRMQRQSLSSNARGNESIVMCRREK